MNNSDNQPASQLATTHTLLTFVRRKAATVVITAFYAVRIPPPLPTLLIAAIRFWRSRLLCTRTHLRFICIVLHSSSACMYLYIHWRIYYHPATLLRQAVEVELVLHSAASIGMSSGALTLSPQSKSTKNPTIRRSSQLATKLAEGVRLALPKCRTKHRWLPVRSRGERS